MSSDFISPSLIPRGVNDERSRTMIKIASDQLDGFDNHDLLFVDAQKVDAQFLPAMAVARTMSDFILPGLSEQSVRNLLSDYRNIHAQSGYISGVRRALGAVGISVNWKQWWEMEPKGPHNTHNVTVQVNELVFADEPVILNERVQQLSLHFINLTSRWSQDVNFKLAAGYKGTFSVANAARALAFKRDGIVAGRPNAFTALCGVANTTAAMSVQCETVVAGRDRSIKSKTGVCSALAGLQVMKAQFTAPPVGA